MKNKRPFLFIGWGLVPPAQMDKRSKLLTATNAIEDIVNNTTIGTHFWAAGRYIRRAVRNGLPNE